MNFLRLVISFLVCLSCAFPRTRLGYASEPRITISAASSLQEPLSKLLENKNTSLNFAASGTLARQILSGAKVHLFISANSLWVDLEEKNLLDKQNTSSLISNQLALVEPCTASTQKITEAKRIAVGDFEYVPVGGYAKSYLENLGLLDVLRGKLIFTTSETQAVQYSKGGLVDLAFVYYTSALFEKKICLVQLIDKSQSGTIAYQIAIIEKNKNPFAVEIYQYLKSPAALQVFENYGFLIRLIKY